MLKLKITADKPEVAVARFVDCLRYEINNDTDSSYYNNFGVLINQRIIYQLDKNNHYEILMLLHASDPQLGYWYLHTHFSDKKKRYVTAIVRALYFIDAPTIRLAFERFDYWIKEQGYYSYPFVLSPINKNKKSAKLKPIKPKLSGAYLEHNFLDDKAFEEISSLAFMFSPPEHFPLVDRCPLLMDIFSKNTKAYQQETRLSEVYAQPKLLQEDCFNNHPIASYIEDTYREKAFSDKRIQELEDYMQKKYGEDDEDE